MLPENFIYVTDIPFDIRYATSNNFIGRPLDGYHQNRCIVSRPLADALSKAQQLAIHSEVSLFIFEAYRPLRATEDIVKWTQSSDTLMQHRFYPNLDKFSLIQNDYIAVRSTHTRGAAVDVTLINPETSKELDMGTEFDFFGDASHTAFTLTSPTARKNRDLLCSIMRTSGFENYEKEWWHFTLKNEPYPDTYFDFKIE